MDDPQRFGRRLTLVLTNAIKVAGVVIGVAANRGVLSSRPSVVVLAFAAFLIAGGQFSEETILSLFARFFGMPPPKDDEDKRGKRGG
jgi:hypothetical protein